jgi:NAD(P)-dependent dehydrogenase (short-subunit alcohol dehydrogenase family)
VSDYRKAIEVNLLGTLEMTQAVVPAMKAQGAGRVVMINSMSAHRIQPLFGAYTASKAALESATKTLAMELGQYGIRVNGIHPGYIWGDSVQWYFGQLAEQRGVTAEEVYAEVASGAALRYLPPSREIAGTVLFLASDLAAPVTGQSIGVDCGHWITG